MLDRIDCELQQASRSGMPPMVALYCVLCHDTAACLRLPVVEQQIVAGCPARMLISQGFLPHRLFEQ